MEPDRQEVYERIPWETLEQKRNDRQWVVYAVAGAVVLGALSYSFMRNQPTADPSPMTVAAPPAPVTTVVPKPDSSPSTVSSPIVMAEADLFAVDIERLVDEAAGHAEWFAVEYVAVDGSDESSETLAALLPEGIPLPQAPDDTQVFVDWVRARGVTQTGPTSYEVEVLVRSLVSSGTSGFARQAPLVVSVPIEIGDDGRPRVAGAPSLAMAEPVAVSVIDLAELPDDLAIQLEASHGEVVGGIQLGDGSWEVVVMAEGSDGVSRPVAVRP